MSAPAFRRVWLADFLGSLGYSGACFACRRQFLSRNVYAYLRIGTGTLFCSERCAHVA